MSSDNDRVAILDVAGASIGGAARFLRELDGWRAQDPTRLSSTTVIGRGLRLTPSWLLRREWITRSAPLRIALNNASFCSPAGQRVVLLRNALHYSSRSEMDTLGFTLPRELRAQIPLIRGLAARADRIVVPCTAMRERVLRYSPKLSDRIIVRGHPVSKPDWSRDATWHRDNSILVPIVPAPYKNLDQHINALLKATTGLDIKIIATAARDQLPGLKDDPRLELIGVVSAKELDAYWGRASAVYYPTSLESFGYPLAEARVGGRWIIAQASSQNSEIAGDALAAFELGRPETLKSAVQTALGHDPDPDPVANDPDDYFHFLMGLA